MRQRVVLADILAALADDRRGGVALGELLQHVLQRLAADALHEEPRLAAGIDLQVVDRHDARVLELADRGAESPQETRLRLALIRGGLPRPVTQIPVRNVHGRVVRRIDMGWPRWKVGVEYDGEQHWIDAEKHAGDIDRLEFLAGLGWRIIRVSARHLRADRSGIIRRAEQALAAAAA